MSYIPSPAGFWKRFVAYFIDLMLVSCVLNLLLAPVITVVLLRDDSVLRTLVQAGVAGALTPQDALAQLLPPVLWFTALSTLGYAVLAAVYFIGMEGSLRQATLGKHLLGLKVTARDGTAPGLARVAGRFVAASLSWLTLNLGHALAGWTRERRALHDYLAGTRVENVDPANTAMPGWGWAIVALNAVFALALLLVAVAAATLVALHLMR